MRAGLFLAAIFAVTAGAADWQATLGPRTPGGFGPMRSLNAKYTFGWSMFTAGQMELEFTRKGGLQQLHAKGGSIGPARALWRLDADATSLVRASTLLPVRLVQTEEYSDEKRTTTIVYGSEGATRTSVREPTNKDSGKTKRFKFSPLHEMQSTLLFLRSQRLRKGDVVRLVAYPGGGAYLVEMEVLGREKITALGKEWPAIKLALRLKEVTKGLELKTERKLKSLVGWLSDDSDRLLLKAESEVMIGKVWMDLKQVNFLVPKN